MRGSAGIHTHLLVSKVVGMPKSSRLDREHHYQSLHVCT